MTDDTYEDDVDLDDADDLPQRMPFTVLVPVVLFGAVALITGFASFVNLTARDQLAGGVFLASVAVAAAVGVVGLIWRQRWGSYVAFGLALILALSSLRDPGLAVSGLGFLATVMGTLMTRSAKDWFGFA